MYSYELEARKKNGKKAGKQQDDLNISGNHHPQEMRANKGLEEQCQGKTTAGTPG